MASARRIGAETSKTRAVVLDSAEQLMIAEGYAAVTYRNVAGRAGVTAGLVQYYFPTLDDLFLALLRRRSERNLERLLTALESRPDEPLRVVWEFSTEETTAALMMEFMALANHRKTIRAEILAVTERARRAELEALQARWNVQRDSLEQLTPAAMLFLMHWIPKMIQLEDAFGASLGHQDLLDLVERHLNAVEPRQRATKRSPAVKATSTPRKRTAPRRT